MGWVCKTWFQDNISVLSLGARKCPCKVIANSRGGGGLKEILMYESGISGRVWRFKPKTFLGRGMNIS